MLQSAIKQHWPSSTCNDSRQIHSDILAADLETAHELATRLEVAIGEKQTALDEAVSQLKPTQNDVKQLQGQLKAVVGSW